MHVLRKYLWKLKFYAALLSEICHKMQISKMAAMKSENSNVEEACGVEKKSDSWLVLQQMKNETFYFSLIFLISNMNVINFELFCVVVYIN